MPDTDLVTYEWTGERLRAFRKHLRENQTQFAERLGYSNGTPRISDLERGKAEIFGPLSRMLDLWAEREGWRPDDTTT